MMLGGGESARCRGNAAIRLDMAVGGADIMDAEMVGRGSEHQASPQISLSFCHSTKSIPIEFSAKYIHQFKRKDLLFSMVKTNTYDYKAQGRENPMFICQHMTTGTLSRRNRQNNANRPKSFIAKQIEPLSDRFRLNGAVIMNKCTLEVQLCCFCSEEPLLSAAELQIHLTADARRRV